MHFIVELEEQLDRLRIADDCYVSIIPQSSFFHPCLTKPCLVYYYNGEKGYIISIDHSETIPLKQEKVFQFLEKHKRIFCLDAKRHMYYIKNCELVDLGMAFPESIELHDTQMHLDVQRRYSRYDRSNSIISVSKHYEKQEKIRASLYKKTAKDPDPNVSKAYFYVESQGIKCTDSFLKENSVSNPEFFLKDGLVYSQYNMYGTTGRATNSFNGLNFLSIPKGERRLGLVPMNDLLVEFDFDAYHLRLIANKVGYEFPKESVHKYLARYYFKDSELTEELYNLSKSITFRQLYGGVDDQYKKIPFFSEMQSMIEDLWEKYLDNELILPTGLVMKRQESIDKLKLFSYYVQNMETHENAKKILSIRDLLLEKKTKLILITYDSFLFDYSTEDGKSVLLDVKEILERDGMLVKHKHGRTYNFQ